VEAGVLGPIGKHLLDRPLGLFGGRPDVFHITASARAPLYPDEPLRIVAAVGKDDDVQVADHGPRIAAGTGPPDDLFERRLFLERLRAPGVGARIGEGLNRFRRAGSGCR